MIISFGSERDERHEHFLWRYATMLEGAIIILHIIIIVVGIGEEIASGRENVGRRHVGSRKPEPCRILHLIDLLGIIGEILANLVAEISVGVLIAHDLHRIVDTDSAVVGR